MKSFFRYAKNRFLYNLIRILVIVGVGFLIGSCSVKADTLTFKIQNRTSLPYSTYWTNGESYTYENDYIWQFIQNRYVTLRTCSTDYLDYIIVSNTSGEIRSIGNSTATQSCTVQGYNGYYIDYYFYIESSTLLPHTDGTIYENDFNLKVYNYHGYTVYQDLVSLTTSSSLDTSSAPDYSDDLSDIQGSINETNDKLDEAEETRKGIWETIKALPSMFLDMLKSLIIPDSFDFIYEFQDALESKLGFIASIPIQFIDFLLNLATASWDEVTSISLPEIEMFGVKWWNSSEIDISEGLKMFEAIKYFTDILCVCIMVNTLHKWYQTFTGGGE